MADREVEELLARLLEGQRGALGGDLVGAYLFGSVVTGDFDPGISDVDTVVVLVADPGAAQLDALQLLHLSVVDEMPQWEDRVEVVYLSSHALSAFRTGTSAAARISPGEPFHAIEVDDRWLIDWYQLREVGIALWGPPAGSLVPDISGDEYVRAVRRHLLDWSEPVDGLATRGSQGYTVLTMCRGLRTWRTGDHVSKREAARWACDVVPEHAGLIRDAVVWRERSRVDDDEPIPDVTGRFVTDVQRLIQG